MAGWDDVSAPVATSGGWDAVSSPVPIPKMPDISGAQKMAQDNLAANDNKETPDGGEAKPPQTPQQRLDTAVGMPANSLLNPDDTTPIPANIRRQYTKTIRNGDASNFGDFMQTMLHGVLPIAAGAIRNTEAMGRIAKSGLEGVGEGYEAGTLFPTPVTNNVYAMVGEAANIPFQGVSAAFSGVTKALYQTGMEMGSPSLARDLALFPEAMMASPGMAPHLSEAPMRASGPWDNLPGKDILAEHVGKIADKPGAAVTSSDFDQTIAQGTTHKAPSAQDFKAVETVTGGALNEKTLHVIYAETGVTPDQVFEDARRDPQVGKDAADGRIPEAYEHLAEPKQVAPEQAERLQVTRDEAGRAFGVVDAEGDYVQGGFNSYEEARHYIEDKAAGEIGDEPPEWKNRNEPATEKTAEGEQSVIPGAERISDKDLAERKMEGAKQPEAPQKPANEGLFDVAGRGQGDLLDLAREAAHERVPVPVRPAGEVGSVSSRSESHPAENKGSIAADQGSGAASGQSQLSKKTVQPSQVGKPTSLYTFLRDNGGIKDEGGYLASRGEKSLIRKNGMEWDDATLLAQQHGYFTERLSVPELQDKLFDSNGGRDHYRSQDANRVLKTKENAAQQRESDPAYIEDYADKLGLDTARLPDETERQFITRLKDAIKEFYKNTEGSAEVGVYRKALGDVIIAAEKFVGKLTGGFFDKLGEAYIRTFTPEMMGDKALRADAYMAKHKVAKQEAENAFYSQWNKEIVAWDKKTPDERIQWLYDHETGRWDEELDPDHAQFQALLDAAYKAEKASGASEAGYKENYLPHAWENPDAVRKYFRSEAFIKKYGRDGFTKQSTFKLIQDGVRAGFKLKTDNPGRMLVARLLAGHDMIATMDLLHDMESSGIAKRATAFSLDKKIAKTQTAIADLEAKYKAASDKINDPKQMRWDFADPAVSKYMKTIEARLTDLKSRLDAFSQEKSANKLTPEQMRELKGGGFKVIGPDSHVWNIHQQVAPLWKNAMESKGLWEKQGVLGDAYRTYTAGKAIWTSVKLGLSLFHPVHVAMIHLASGIAGMAEHLIQGGKLSDLALKDTGATMGITGNTFKVQDHPAVAAWKTISEARTPEQQRMVTAMLEGGFKPTMSARDTIKFKENFDKAISGVGLNNLRLIGSALQLPGKLFAPFFEHWIPGLKAEIYLRRAEDAMRRDPSLAQDAGRRGEVFRQITKDTDRTYGEMNNEVQFWNKTVRDSFNAAFISGGWKLAQIYNARGLLQPLKIAVDFAKTGEFSRESITYNMLHAYTYTALTLATGAAINVMLGNPIGTAKDTVWDIVKNLVAPQTGEKNPDGTPIRLNQPAFAKEAYSLAHEINTKGLIAGSGSFLYHQTLIPGITDTLNNRDFTGRKIISDPTDLHQWANAGWDSIKPIAFSTAQKAEAKQSKVGEAAAWAGFPLAGAYLNQTPFEQKVLYTYDEQNPPKGDVYSQKLKAELKSAIANNDAKAIRETKQRMKEEGMTDRQIANAEHIYTKPFIEDAWKKLPAEDQKRLIESASEEEKKKFKIKGE